MNKALIIVDMQNFFLKNMKLKNKKELIKNQLFVIQACVGNKIPVIELEYAGTDTSRGKIISELHKKYTPHATIIKKDNGGFTNTVLEKVLTEIKVKEIILIGINANGCIQDTAMGGLHRGYKVTTALGCIANVWSDDLKLSKNNERWYKEKTKLFPTTNELVKYL